MSDVNRLVYFQSNKYEASYDSKRCSRSVADGGRSVGFHQCSRKATENVGGWGWCKAHAADARGANGDAEATFVVYIAGRGNLGVYIERVYATGQTDKSITAATVTSIFGHSNHFRGVIKTSDLKVGTLDECTDWAHRALVAESSGYARRADDTLAKAYAVLKISE